MERQQLFNEVLEKLSRWGITQRYRLPITAETEVFHDLRIYGDDLFELVIWLHKRFGVATNLDLGRYAPPETPFPFLRLNALIARRQYDSLTLRDVMAAIQAKSWFPSAGLAD
ncbi:DUF1493 family protein [Bradyrhizobium septentrionale]|uniref:DUF1493 family protein n=1 Tax=Bradyrhizobium septentrionale TaxID=1404411 RepID=A0A973W0V2_9BRAD|nr:DUF1493 family protein [Bradyrhizobium septentrionale]UGY13901.1 DUF1493 family protein [Bradyrhizobium septentrionale]UGY22455.1 DUF1493 family protein [Bradyrhizobium septentrionale]